MCGCSVNFNGDERDVITQDELGRGFDFTGNRPSVIEVGETWEDPSFDFTGNRPSVIEIGEGNHFEFLGKKARARREERRLKKQGQDTTTQTTRSTEDEDTNTEKNIYGGGWFGRNWHWLLIGAVVVGGGIYIYKKRKA
jgi:hypothetical protein